MEQEEGAAPAPVTEAETITLRVKDQSQEEMFFKVKKSTKMSKIIEAYAARKGIATNAFRFLFEGKRLQPDATPKMLEMEEDDQIDAFLETVGGV